MEKKLLSFLFGFSLFFLNPLEGFGQCSDTNPPAVSITSSAIVICAEESVTFNASTQNIGPSPTYQWRVNAINQTGATNPTFITSNLQNGSVVSVLMNPNCTGTTAVTSNSITIQVNAIPSAPTITGDNSVCAGDAIVLSASNITGAIYSWTGPDNYTGTGKDITIIGASTNMAGTYRVTATVNGCTGIEGTLNIAVNPIPGAPTAGNNGAVCVGSSINLTAGNITGATYSWSGPNGFTSTDQNPTRTGATTAMAGTYTVTATVNECSSVAATTVVNVNPAPAAPTAANGGAVCVGGTINLTASNITGATYSWTGPNGFTSTDQNPTRTGATTAMAGTYSVIATVDGCPSSPATSTVLVNTIPSAPNASNNGPVCVGGTINLTANTIAGATYSWTGPNGFTSSSQNPVLTGATTAMAGTYTVTATVNGCVSSQASTTVVVNTIPSAPTAANGGAICVGGTIVLTASTIANATYSWTGPGGFTSNIQNPTIAGATAAMAGTYNVTATVNGCTSTTASTTIVVNTIPSAPTAGSNSPVCMNGTINLTASSITGATYSWTGPDGFSSTSQNPTISGLTAAKAGTYSVIATVNGCTSPAGTTNIAITPNVTPSVSITSTSAAICTSAREPVTFTATPLNGGTSPTYQWRRNGSPISGATGSTYTVNSLPNPSTISVVMTSNATCASTATATSNDIVMVVYAQNPTTGTGNNQRARITSNISGSICPGPNATGFIFNAPTDSDRVEIFEWNLPPGFTITAGAGTNSITVSVLGPGAITANNQIVNVQAINPCGSTTSQNFLVNVNTFAGVDAGPDITMCYGNPQNLTNTLAGNASSIASWEIITRPTGTSGSGEITGGAWDNETKIPFVFTPTSVGTYILRTTTNTAAGNCPAASRTGTDDVTITVNAPPAITTQPAASQTLCSGTPASFNVTATGNGLTYQWLKNGTNIQEATSSTYEISSPTTGDSGEYTVIVSGLSPCVEVTSTISELLVNEIIVIEEQPVANQTLCSGSDTTLSVTATGTGLTYQWKKDGINISGENSATLALVDVNTNDSGNYTVEISGTDPCEPVTSNISELVVNEIVAIIDQPVSTQTLCSGSPANFSLTATGTGLTYQWKKDGTNITGENSNTLTLVDITTADSGEYTVEVTGTDPCDPVTSATSELVVNEIINISSQPEASQNLCSGSTADFSVTATGTNLTYQWKKNGTNLTGATSSTLSLENITTEDSGNYTVEISGSDPCEPILSNTAELVVNEIINISEQPAASQTLCIGSTANFGITATGTGLSYQWKKDGVDIANQTTASLILADITTADAGEYTVLISGTDPCEPVLSEKAVLIVNELTEITQDLDYGELFSVCAGFPVEFGIEAIGTDVTYEWFRGSTSTGITTSSLSISQVSSSDAGTYTVVVTGACGNVTSNPVDLIVNQSITIDTQPEVSIPVCLGENSVSINIEATGDIYDYVWRRNGIPVSDGSKYSGSSTATLTILNLEIADSGSFDVVISSPEGSCSQIISNPSNLTVYEPPTVDAGPDLEVCSTATSIALSGGNASNHSSLIWTTNGGGQINNGTDLATAAYTPVEADFGNTLVFTLTAIMEVDGEQICEDAIDTRNITIIPQPVITEFGYISTNATATSGEFCESDEVSYTPHVAGDNLIDNGTGVYTVDNGALIIDSSTGAFAPMGTPPGVYIITYSFTVNSENAGCEVATKTFTVTIGAKPVADFTYGDNPYCSDSENISPTFPEGDRDIGIFTSTSTGLVFIDTATGEINVAASTPGTYEVTNTVDYSAQGCAVVTHIASITINEKPVADFNYSASEYCSDATNPVAQFTGNEIPGIFSEKNGDTGLIFMDTSTGEIDIAGSEPGNYIIVNTLEIDGDGCDVVSAEFPITITQKPDPVFSYNSTGEYCISDGIASVTQGYAQGGTFSSLTLGSNLNLTTGEITWNSTDNIIGEHTITYIIPGAGGCEPVSFEASISIDTLPIAGELNFQGFGRILETCSNPGPDYDVPIELTGHAGTITRWRYREGSQPEWITIDHTEPILTAAIIRSLSINESTIFEAEIVNGGCTTGGFSQSATLSIISSDIAPNPVTASPGVLCTGEDVTLTASSGYGTGSEAMVGGAFDNASITNHGWRVRKEGSTQDLGFSTSSNNTRPNIWSRVTPHSFTTADINNPSNLTDILYDSGVEDGNKGFVLVSGNNPSTLETPIFNTFSMETATLTFDQAYNLTAGSSIRVEISTDGGATYNYVVFEREGPLRSGNFGNFGIVTNVENKIVIDLSEYLGLGNLRIRFRYLGTRTGDTWAADDIKLPEGTTGVEMIWTDYSDPENPVEIGRGTSETWTPSLIGLNEFEIRTRLTFDSTGAQCPVVENFTTVSVFVFDQYSSTAEATVGSCGFERIQLKGSIINSATKEMESFPTPDGYSAKWEVVTKPGNYTFSEAHFFPSIIDPEAIFSPGVEGEFTVQYSLSRPEDGYKNESCPPVYNKITFTVKACTSLDFDGVDDFVDLGEEYTGNYSIEAWIRPFDRPIDGGGTTNASNGTIISTSFVEINMEDLAGLVTKNDRWYHIAVDSGRKLYVDGIDSGRIISKTGTARAFIGARWNAPNPENHFSGWIEEVRIWNGLISQENIRFTMNQRLKAEGNIGIEVEMTHPDAPAFGALAGYYQLIITNILNGGYTPNLAGTGDGKLRNMETLQENTAPLPYFTANNGSWDTDATWAHPDVWQIPNSGGLDWNIVRTSHNVNATRDISVLGLISEANTLGMVGNIPANESHLLVGTGNALTISHYLKLDGIIDLNGESQLLQPELSILDNASSGHLDRDQQGKRNSFIYNYWASPVSTTGTPNNGGYTVAGILRDPASTLPINFQDYHGAADGARTSPITISTYWLWGYSPAPANVYAEWDHIRKDGSVESGEGFTMKGTDGNAGIDDGQNYTFRGKPHNGEITLPIGPNQNYLIGNPYPSALDATQFITDHLGTNPVFDGSLYFWDHFVVVDHILKEYIGGYAVRNLTSGVPAASIDDRINNEGDRKSKKYPGQFIPVGQGFLINSTNPESESGFGGDIKFKNSQRDFVIEGSTSLFLKPEVVEKTGKSKNSEFKKIRLSFSSPIGYWRQILVGAVPGTTDGFDLGYDAHLFDDNLEDMYWVQGNNNLVIQAVPDFNKDRILPLGLRIKENKEFTIRIDTVENALASLKIYLNDKLNDSIHDLRKGHYVSKSEPGTFNERFEVIFFKEEVITPDPGPLEPGEEVFTLSLRHSHTGRELQILNPDQLKINHLYLFDLNGNQLMEYENISNDKEVRLPVQNYSSGVYLIKVYAERKIISKKIIISN